MISPEEIKQQALKWWPQVLQNHVNGEPFFPRMIERIGKVRSGDVRQQFEKVQHEVERLFLQSKKESGSGYRVETDGVNFRRSGSHDLPKRIAFDSFEDYLTVTAKKKEWTTFTRNLELILGQLPVLKDWAYNNVLWLTKNDTDWNIILQVCLYFISTPRPQLYIRQLPIEVHTKFIEENSALLQSLLDFIMPDHIRDSRQKKFAERYFLKHDEPIIRTRLLHESVTFHAGIKDFSIPLSTFHSLNLPCKRILISENKMTFLTLPEVPSSIAVWSGGGFNISYLKDIYWWADKEIYYWGDMDAHGFQMLHQIRTYYPHTVSLMMDMKAYKLFEQFAVSTSASFSGELSLLNSEEQTTLDFLRSNAERNRLEQERIPQWYVADYIAKNIKG